jgi:hypothetical protein
MNSRCLGREVRKLGSSTIREGSTFQNAQNPHESLVAHQLVEQLLVTRVEYYTHNLEQQLQL